MRHELSMARHLLEEEVLRTAKVQQQMAADEASAQAAREELQRRLDKAVKKATEQGLDVKLGLANEDFSEDNFKMGAKLREKEAMLAEIRALVSSLHNELARREAEYAKLADPKKREVEDRLSRCIETVDSEEAKSIQLTTKLSLTKESLQGFKAEARAAREAILERLVNNEEEREKYSHVCVAELTRLMIQERNTACFFTSAVRSSRENKAGMANSRQASSSSKNSSHLLLQELDHLKERNDKLRMTLSRLEGELNEGKKAGHQVRHLKDRVTGLLNKHMKEKDLRIQLAKGTEGVDKKVVVLSDHVERLMLHLKHEIMDKAQAHAAQGRAVKEIDLLRVRNDTIARKNLRKDRVIVELQEGERILEDQLRLLDDKYAELRSKLNVTRHSYRREVKRYMDEAQALRVRWEKETRGALPLELVPLPFNHHLHQGSRKTQSAPMRRQSNSHNNNNHHHHHQQRGGGGRQVVSEGGAKAERLRFDINPEVVSAPPMPSIPPPDINLSLLQMHQQQQHHHHQLAAGGPPSGAGGDAHEPWSDEKLQGLQQVLDDQKRKSMMAAGAT